MISVSLKAQNCSWKVFLCSSHVWQAGAGLVQIIQLLLDDAIYSIKRMNYPLCASKENLVFAMCCLSL